MPADLHVGIEFGRVSSAVAVTREGILVAGARADRADDPQGDVASALETLFRNPAIDRERVGAVMIACGYAAEALERREGLGRVAVVRIAGRLDPVVKPLAGWPAPLRAAIGGEAIVLAGGRELDGSPTTDLDELGLRRFLEAHADVDAVAIAGQLSVVAPDDELRAAEIVRSVLGNVPVSLSHELGAVGLLERENTAVLDAALTRRASAIADGLRAGLQRSGMSARAYLVRDDGTLATLEYVVRHPTYALDGRAASGIRGAGRLAELGDALVCDVDDRRAIVGRLAAGHPRDRATPATLAGVNVSVRVPDLAVVDADGSHPPVCQAELLADAISGMSEQRAGEPLIVVGPKHDRVPDHLPGVSRVVHPLHAEMARAIGAATAPASGFAERLFPAAVDAAIRRRVVGEMALERAVLSGADPDAATVDELHEIPLMYASNLVVRVRVRAVGGLPAS